MRTNCLSALFICMFLLSCNFSFSQANFTAPDTVCVNAPVNITNTSTGATSHFWNFCVANVNSTPVATNLGTLGGVFSQPVFMDFVEDNGNYYGFVVNHVPGGLVRLDFGNSLLNTPVAVPLGNPSGAMNSNYGNEGIQVVKSNGEWFVLIVGGNPASSTTPRLVTVKFGANITNPSPIGVNWGNIGNMLEPMDLHVFESNGNWYGFTVNAVNNTITRFNLTTNLNNAPTGVNLGNIGGLSYPDGIYVLNDNGNWRGFITNGSTSTITRLDFGASLLNTPVGINLGAVGGTLNQPRDLTIINYCGQAVGFAVNGGNNTISRLNFSSLSSTPTSTNLGNLGGLNFPHSLSKLFRVGNDLYSFITNVNANTLTRLRFSGCTNSSIPNSPLQNPPAISYNTPGTYNVNLSINDGLATQSAYCKQIVVVGPPAITPQLDTSICPGSSANLHPVVTGATTYSWAPSTGLSNPNIANPVATPNVTTQYILTATNGGGCSVTDTIVVTVLSQQTCNPVIVTPGFIAPDTVCVNAPVNITNTTIGATSYFWNFCVANVNSGPVATNLGTLGGVFSQPVFMDFVEDNGNYYGFVVNHNPGGLVRLDFGNSLLNTPVAVPLGNPGGAMNSNYGNEGIQVVKSNGEWFVLIVGGNPASSTTPRLVTVKFGANITNPTPIGVNWGNIGNMLEPMDLHIFQSNGNWYGFTVNAVSNTITRFNFSNNFNNAPTGVNLGNIGGLSYPDGIYVLNDNGNWRGFITNGSTSTITRLDFGTSLLNTPVGVNLGTVGGVLNQPRDLTIINYCGQAVGFAVNGGNNAITRLNFSSLTSTPTSTNLGNLGGLNFPHSLSKLFRVGNDLFSFITNANNNTITRLRFNGCTNSSTPNSSLQNPPVISYNTPGTYNINLSVDDGLTTQAAYCKQIVVVAPPAITPQLDTSICPGSSANLHPVVTGATTYSWTPSTGLSDPNISNPVATPTVTTQYILTATNGGGCSKYDTVIVNVLTPQQCNQIIVTPGFNAPDTVCVGNSVNITNTSINASSYYWNFCASDLTAAPTGFTLGNPGGFLTTPCFTDYVFDNGNYYGFVTSANPASLVRLDFGNSLLNTPTATNLGNFGNIIPLGAQGIQIINEGGVWYVFIVGGDIIADPAATSRIVKLNFGASLSNPTPVVTNWGNIGAMAYPHDLYMIKNAGIWYGFTINYANSTITRFTFGPNFNSPPVGVNFGNLGALNKPTGLFMTNDNGTWRMFVANYNNHTISRIDFGNTIINPPTGSVNLGNPGTLLNNTRDLHIFNNCGQYVGYSINDNTNEIIKLSFASLTSVPGAVSLGTSTGVNTPHSISKIFTVGVDLYAFVVNAYANSISRIKFSGCSSSSMPSSTLQNPPAYSYNTAGTYNINLTVDNGMLSQGAFCKKVVVMPLLTHSPTQSISLCNSATVKIGSSIKPATYLWNNGLTSDSIVVTASGTYWVETSRYGCTVRDSFIVNIAANSGIDFAYQQNMCSPKTIQFTTGLNSTQSFNWNFGNNQSNNSSLQPLVTYTNYGNYTVKLVSPPVGTCADSVVKTIAVDNVFDNNLVGNIDTTICVGDSILLRTNGLISNYCWTASTGPIPTALNSWIKPAVPTTYFLTSQVLGNNLLTNADFSNGNTGFTSDYNYVSPNVTEGQYWVGTSPTSWNAAMSSCGDHTSGTGNMLIVNGSPVAGSRIWTQTIPVSPNTNYQFSTWLASVVPANPASLQVSINNIKLGNSINGIANTCQWNRFTTNWNSGNNTTALISIINNNTVATGNDFAIDDLFFGTVVTKNDSFHVSMTGLCDSIKLTGPDKICSPADTVTYSIYKSANCNQQFSLFVDNTFADIISQTPTTIKLVFKKNGTTSIKVSFVNSCKIVVDSLLVTVKFSPTNINLGPDITGCRDTTALLNAHTGFVSYQWQDGSSDSTFQANAPGTYHVLAQNLCGAQFKDTFRIIKLPTVPFNVNPLNATVCAGDSVQFTASGGTSYQWQPSSNFSNPTGASTRAIVSTSQNYTCFITDLNCGRDTLVTIPVTASSSANISVTKSNDVSCGTDTAVLKATGGVSYIWTPNLNIVRGGNGQITVNPGQSMMYHVIGTDALGCKGTDSVLVAFINNGDQQLFMPDAFSPNGDGLNEVFRPKLIGPAKKYQFSVYNRWGQLVFRSTTPGQGWDGKYQSKDQPQDVYVYYVTAEGGCNGKFENKGTFVLIR